MESAPADRLGLPAAERARLWGATIAAVEEYLEGVASRGTSTATPVPEEVRARVESIDFDRPVPPLEALRFVVEQLWEHAVHTSHPRYFGLFNPAPTTMAIAADALVAAFNPQLAAWSHSPFAVEVETHLIREFGRRFGYSAPDGTFASGGAEANHTALLLALTHAQPEVGRVGLRGLRAEPRLYVGEETHHSVQKAAMVTGLGRNAVRVVPSTPDGLDLAALERAITRDRSAGAAPFLLVATVGTTAGGELDPVGALADVAARENLWLHVDAAWAGAATLVPEFRSRLGPLERADSITLDAHKWLSTPMGGGMVLTRHRGLLERTFAVDTGYMPDHAAPGATEPFRHSLQWSRRFIGLKLFLSLAVAGWEGYASAIRNMVALGDRLRDGLRTAGWSVVNRTWLPLVCVRDEDLSDAGHARVAEALVHGGEAWVSTVRLRGVRAIRVCVTNYRTGPEHVDDLVAALGRARDAAAT